MAQEMIPPELSQARERFLALVANVRPELHRYSSRLTGSVIDGEDVVQDALAKAFYAISLATELPPLRPWLFRITHNTALDFLRRYEQTHEELVAELPVEPVDEAMDPYAVRSALAAFRGLPVLQRSVVILKDVLGHSLEETAETLGTTVPAVKAALVRGRARLRGLSAPPEAPEEIDPGERDALHRYAHLFNAKDWEGVRALIAEECQLDLVAKAARRGKGVASYFGRYAAEQVRLGVGRIEGHLALAAFTPESGDRPAYFVLLAWRDGRVTGIRDYRYVPYVAREAEFEPL